MQSGLIFLYILIAIVVLVVNGLLASKMSKAAEQKGHSERTFFHLCFWLGIYGYLVVLALPDLKLRSQNDQMIMLQTKLVNSITTLSQKEKDEKKTFSPSMP